MREKEIEAWLRKQIEALGGLAWKFVSPGNAGVPDRIAILPYGEIWFIELKAEGERPRALQNYQMRQLQKRGCRVAVIAGMEQAHRWIEMVS